MGRNKADKVSNLQLFGGRLGDGVKCTLVGVGAFFFKFIFPRLSSPGAEAARRAKPLRLVFQNVCSHARKCIWGSC